MIATERQRDSLERLLWGEARGEIWQIKSPWPGLFATRCTTETSNHGGGGLCRRAPEAVPSQLLEQGGPEYAYLSGQQIPFRELVQARIATDEVSSTNVPDATGGAIHYYAILSPKPPD